MLYLTCLKNYRIFSKKHKNFIFSKLVITFNILYLLSSSIRQNKEKRLLFKMHLDFLSKSDPKMDIFVKKLLLLQEHEPEFFYIQSNLGLTTGVGGVVNPRVSLIWGPCFFSKVFQHFRWKKTFLRGFLAEESIPHIFETWNPREPLEKCHFLWYPKMQKNLRLPTPLLYEYATFRCIFGGTFDVFRIIRREKLDFSSSTTSRPWKWDRKTGQTGLI